MRFTVKHRNRTGRIAYVEIDAENRAGCLRECARRGVSPVDIQRSTEARHRFGSSLTAPTTVRRRIVTFFAIALIVAIAASAWFLLREDPDSCNGAAATAQGRAKMTRGALSDDALPKTSSVCRYDGKRVITPADANLQPMAKPKPGFGELVTNGFIVVEREKAEVEFDSELEVQLNWIFTTNLGDPTPPLLDIQDHELRDIAVILDRKLEIAEGDSELAVDIKATLAQAKKELSKFMDEGGSAQEFLKYYWSVLDAAHGKWQRAVDNVRKVVSTEDPEVAKAYIAQVNSELAEQGIKAVDVPSRFKKRYLDDAATHKTGEEGD